jgi:hypothetical protein
MIIMVISERKPIWKVLEGLVEGLVEEGRRKRDG